MSNTKNTRRIATVNTTGHRYFVQQIDIRAGKVHCWGEAHSFDGLKSKHRASVAFYRADVTVSEIQVTSDLLRELTAQGIARLRADGFGVRVASKSYTITRRSPETSDQALAAAEAAEAIGDNDKAGHWLEVAAGPE